jgi:hypothetical protein
VHGTESIHQQAAAGNRTIRNVRYAWEKNVVRPYESWTTNAGNRKCIRNVRYGDGPANCRDERTTDRPTGAVTDETVGVTNHGAVCVSRPARLRDESEPRDRAPNPRFQPHTTTNDKKKNAHHHTAEST